MLSGHDKCKFNCKTISLEDRVILCNSFCGLKDYIRQRDYIIKCTRQEKIKRRKTNQKTTTQREFSNHYSFLLREEKIIVCSDFFHKTLNISTKMSRLAMERRTETEKFAGKDNGGLNLPANKTPDDFNVVESYYCRANTNRKFLESGLSIGKMYKLFQKSMKENELVSKRVKKHIIVKYFVMNLIFRFTNQKRTNVQCARDT